MTSTQYQLTPVAFNAAHSISKDGLWVHLFAESRAWLEFSHEPVFIWQETSYPWSGAVRFIIDLPSQRAPQPFTLYQPFPGWCEGYALKVNGSPCSARTDLSGYLAIRRKWQGGDQVKYAMEIPICPVFANPDVRLLQGRIASSAGGSFIAWRDQP